MIRKLKKGLFGCILGATLATGTGCAHQAARTQNTITAASYEAALEICVQRALNQLDNGTAKSDVAVEYEVCASLADKQFGRKP